MDITIDKQLLGRELALLQQYVLDRKSHIPALSFVRLTASYPHRLQLAGTDLDVTLMCDTEATVRQAGRCVLPGRKLCDIVKSLPSAPVTLKVKAPHKAELLCGRSHFKLTGLPPEEFPTLPVVPAAQHQLPAQLAHTLIERTRFALTEQEGRYNLAGAHFRWAAEGVRVVATDGHRLALAEQRAASSENSLSCLLPKKALHALAHLATLHEGEIGWHLNAQQLACEIGPRALVCRLLQGEFPDYARIIPSQMAHCVTLSGGDLLAMVRRVAVMADEKMRGLSLEFKHKKLRVFTSTPEHGAAEEVLPITYDGPGLTLGLNARYLSEYLAIIGSGAMTFSFDSPHSVVRLAPTNDPHCDSFVLIMPLALPSVPESGTASTLADAVTDTGEAAPL